MRSFLQTIDRTTLRDIALVCLADAIVGLSFGAIAVAGGLELWVPVAMSLFVFAGGAQFAALGVVLAGGSPAAGVMAGLVLNMRLLAFGFSVGDLLGKGWLARLAGAHLITDETVAFAMVQDTRERKQAAFWISGIGLFVVWNLSVLLGALLGTAIGDTNAIGLDAAFPTVLLALVLPALKDTNTRIVALIGAVVAVAATPFLPAGLPVLLALVGLVWARRVPPAVTADGAGA